MKIPLKHNSHKTLFQVLYKKVQPYLSRKDLLSVHQAYHIARDAHEGQHRKSGEDYIYHPISVAIILSDMQMDVNTINAALLHDCIEDTDISRDDLKKAFGNEVSMLVDGVSKLADLKFDSLAEQQAKNFQKLLLAMSRDIRVIIIKLADRLHNMRTLAVVARHKQMRIAKETLDIYSPIAKRLGLFRFGSELENLAFQILMPYRYRVLSEAIKKKIGNDKKEIRTINKALVNHLKKDKYQFDIVYRVKEVYSVYLKMKHGRPFHEIYDLYAFRLIVGSMPMCYQILGAVHSLYKPIPGKFKDYIALPKSNDYQSLHTVLFTDNKFSVEVQIRTKEMNNVAENGIAAHWRYKLKEKKTGNVQTKEMVSSLLDIQRASDTSLDFLANVKGDLFPNQVFVFTPKGDVIELPYRSTALDFAYAIHTKVGDYCSKIKIDQQFMPLATELKSGQTVEVVTQKTLRVHPNWLNLINTSKAKSAIKLALKNTDDKKSIKLGKYLLQEGLSHRKKKLSLSIIRRKQWTDVFELFSCKDKAQLFLKIGLGEAPLVLVIDTLMGKQTDKFINHSVIKSTKEMAINFGNCCHPIPQDKVVGVMSKGKGLVVHRINCNNLKSFLKRGNHHRIELEWDAKYKESFKVMLRCQVENKRGMLAKVTDIIANMEMNIEDVSMKEQDKQMKYLDFIVSVKNREEVAHLFREIKKVEGVYFVNRLIN